MQGEEPAVRSDGCPLPSTRGEGAGLPPRAFGYVFFFWGCEIVRLSNGSGARCSSRVSEIERR